MGAVSGNSLKARTRRVQGVNGGADEEITAADAWCQSFADHGYDQAKTAYDAASADDRAKIDGIL